MSDEEEILHEVESQRISDAATPLDEQAPTPGVLCFFRFTSAAVQLLWREKGKPIAKLSPMRFGVDDLTQWPDLDHFKTLVGLAGLFSDRGTAERLSNNWTTVMRLLSNLDVDKAGNVIGEQDIKLVACIVEDPEKIKRFCDHNQLDFLHKEYINLQEYLQSVAIRINKDKRLRKEEEDKEEIKRQFEKKQAFLNKRKRNGEN